MRGGAYLRIFLVSTLCLEPWALPSMRSAFGLEFFCFIHRLSILLSNSGPANGH